MSIQPRQTCLVFDPICLDHHVPQEKNEKRERVLVIQDKLAPLGLQILERRRATREDLLRCHSSHYLAELDKNIQEIAAKADDVEDGCKCLSTGDTLICSDSVEVAHWAAGGVLAGVDAVIKGVAKNVFCNIRPPGHHATKDQGMGYCIFNNVAIAARYAQAVHGVRKVLIVDWDVHHGNGTQDIFYDDPSVYYFSFHERRNYPFTGKESEIGHGAAAGTTENHRIQKDDEARQKILKLFRENLPRKMQEFQPELVLISAGFDSRAGDPLGGLNLTDQDFAEMTGHVKAIADRYARGRVVSVLEGGYNLEGISAAAFAHVNALMDD